MKFKDYFEYIYERKYYFDLSQKIKEVIQRLVSEIKNKDKFESGSKITIPFVNGKEITFAFYKEYTENTRKENKKIEKVIGVAGKTIAKYDPDTKTIEVYLNNFYNLKRGENKNLFKYLKEKFPISLKILLLHELSHAYEDLILNISQFTFNSQIGSSPEEYDRSYINAPTEKNAHLLDFIVHQSSLNPMIQVKLQNGDIKAAINELIRLSKNNPIFSKYTPEDMKKLHKEIYNFLSNLI